MTEDPAPYWITRYEPIYSAERAAWIAAAVWIDATISQEWRAEGTQAYSTYAEALLASQTLGDDHALLQRLLDAKPRDMEAYWRQRWGWAKGDDSSPIGRQLNVLACINEQPILKILHEMMRAVLPPGWDIRLSTAGTSTKLVRLAQHRKFDLCLVLLNNVIVRDAADLEDRAERVVRAVRQIETTLATPVVALAGHPMFAEKARGAGVQCCFDLPVEPASFTSAINAWVDRVRQSTGRAR